jgi:hypothetical protein
MYIYTYVHTYLHTYINFKIFMYIHSYIHTYIHTNINFKVLMYFYFHTYIHTVQNTNFIQASLTRHCNTEQSRTGRIYSRKSTLYRPRRRRRDIDRSIVWGPPREVRTSEITAQIPGKYTCIQAYNDR